MNKKDWLDTATKKVLFRPDRKTVRRELEEGPPGPPGSCSRLLI